MTGLRPNMIVNHSVLQQSLPDAKETNIQLAVISIGVVRDSMFTDHAAQWSCIEREKQSTKNWPLRDSKFDNGSGGQTVKT